MEAQGGTYPGSHSWNTAQTVSDLDLCKTQICPSEQSSRPRGGGVSETSEQKDEAPSEGWVWTAGNGVPVPGCAHLPGMVSRVWILGVLWGPPGEIRGHG